MLSDLRLRDFRCFDNATVELDAGFNLFLGRNGEGKTSILEAACVLLRLQSQRSSSLAPAIRIGQNSFGLQGNVDGHVLNVRCSRFRRSVTFDGIEQRTLREYLRMARVVSFANSDIELVRGRSEWRRRYLDFIGAQMDERYRPALRAYERALRGRNALLKRGSVRELAAFDQQLITHGTMVEQLRARIAGMVAAPAAEAYAHISGGRETLAVNFIPGYAGNFDEELARSRPDELRLRQTIVGPHRDDLELTIDGMAAARFASEGQQRSSVLALKLAQANVFAQTHGSAPLLLIDDIFGELDTQRRNGLLDHLPAQGQKLVTATAMEWRGKLDAPFVYELRGRQLMRR